MIRKGDTIFHNRADETMILRFIKTIEVRLSATGYILGPRAVISNRVLGLTENMG